MFLSSISLTRQGGDLLALIDVLRMRPAMGCICYFGGRKALLPWAFLSELPANCSLRHFGRNGRQRCCASANYILFVSLETKTARFASFPCRSSMCEVCGRAALVEPSPSLTGRFVHAHAAQDESLTRSARIERRCAKTTSRWRRLRMSAMCRWPRWEPWQAK